LRRISSPPRRRGLRGQHGRACALRLGPSAAPLQTMVADNGYVRHLLLQQDRRTRENVGLTALEGLGHVPVPVVPYAKPAVQATRRRKRQRPVAVLSRGPRGVSCRPASPRLAPNMAGRPRPEATLGSRRESRRCRQWLLRPPAPRILPAKALTSCGIVHCPASHGAAWQTQMCERALKKLRELDTRLWPAEQVLIHENGDGVHDLCSKLWRQEGGSVDEASRRSKSQSFRLLGANLAGMLLNLRRREA
jgi:hypothetical protein